MALELLVGKRLVLPEDEIQDEATTHVSPRVEIDGKASLVALAIQHDLPLFSGAVTANPSSLVVRAGHGTSATVNISRLTRSLAGGPEWSLGQDSIRPKLLPGQKVALKLLSRRHDSDFRKKLRPMAKEIRVLGQSNLRNHANIIHLIGLDWEGAHVDDPASDSRWPVLLLEHADCGTLTDFFCLGIDITWEVKRDISYDIASGLEALDDAGVTHSDLNFSNVLIFRTGEKQFQAKLCDFGFAIISTDYEDGTRVQLLGFTPPWDPPESSRDIALDHLYKADIYCYGLIVCRIFLESGSPFDQRIQPEPSLSEHSKSLINGWKEEDEVVEICKQSVRDYHDIEKYTGEQLSLLDEIFDLTVRADLDTRADEYATIKELLKPEFASDDAQQRGDFSWETIEAETVPPLFRGNAAESVPNMEYCWKELLPNNIVVGIVADLEHESSTINAQPESRARAAAAAYQLAVCYIQGFGCSVSYEEAFRWLLRSAELGCVEARRDLHRLSEAMEMPIPSRLHPTVLEWTHQNMLLGIEQACEDLQALDPSLYTTADQEMRTVYGGLGLDIFTPYIRSTYNLERPNEFISEIDSANDEVPFEGIDGEGLTWLHFAASNGSVDCMKLLLEGSDININCVTQNGWTPLWMACAAGHSEVAMLLLAAGADPTIPSDTGQTCLHHIPAVATSDVQRITIELVKCGAEVNAKDQLHGYTPLHAACLRAKASDAHVTIQFLIQHGADPCSVSLDGYSPIDLAAMNLRPNILHALLDSSLLSSPEGSIAKTRAQATALKNSIKQMKIYRLRNGGRHYKDKLYAVLRALVTQSTLDAYWNDDQGSHHPLQDACIWTAMDMIEPMLSLPEIDINPSRAQPARQARPLFSALETGNLDLITLLLSYGADVTATDSAGRNVLHYVVEFAPGLVLDFVDRLRRSSCDMRALVNAGTRENGFTPFDVAVQSENFEAADAMQALGAECNTFTRQGLVGEHYTSLQYAAASRRQMSYLLELPSGRPGFVVCDNGFTLFHLTAASFDNALLETDPSQADNVNFLLEHYATREDANQPDHTGLTPLHVAAYFGNTAVAKVLLDVAGADVNAMSRTGATPHDVLTARRLGQGMDQEELRLVDDLERRTWERRIEDMQHLLESYGAVGGLELQRRRAEE